MNEEKKYYQLNWYLPEIENKENIVKIPLGGINNNSCNNMEQNRSDEYLAQIIKDFYYAEALRRIVDDDVENIILSKIEKLNDMHEDVVLLKRIFNDVFVSSRKINFKQNENQFLNEYIWEEINDILNFFFEDRVVAIWKLLRNLPYYLIDVEVDDTKIKNLSEEVQRCYYEEDVEEIINASQELFREIRNSLFTREDEGKFIRLWIKIFSIICGIPSLVDFNTYDAIKSIDEFLGERQKQICYCMLSYTQKEYDITKRQNVYIRKFLWYLKCNKEIKDVYIAKTERMRCYSLMWSKKVRTKYFALSGIDREQYYGNLLMKLVPKHLYYEQVMLNDDVRYYFKNKDYFSYGEISHKDRKKIKGLMSCCERKLLTKATDLNYEYHMFIKLEPCEKCKRAFSHYDSKNQIDIISPKHSYKESREEIKKEDDLAHKVYTP